MFRRIAAQTVVVRARAFATTPIARAGAFTAFLKKSYSNRVTRAQLSKLPVAKRGKLLAKWYGALSLPEKSALTHAGRKIKIARKAAKKGGRFGRKPTAYNRFVAAKAKTAAIRALPVGQRLAAIAKAWNKK